MLIYRNPLRGSLRASSFSGRQCSCRGHGRTCERAYPTMPRNDRGGFGFLILTNMLPNQGNGDIPHSYAWRRMSKVARRCSASRTIVGVNASRHTAVWRDRHASTGRDDRGAELPELGLGTHAAAGQDLPSDGSSIQVMSTACRCGNPTYNLFRPDVSGLFPGLANTSGPVGYRILDTTALAEGLHTIAWTVSDSLGATSGLGSRYFTVANARGCAAAAGAGECRERISRLECARSGVGCGRGRCDAAWLYRLHRIAVGARRVSPRLPVSDGRVSVQRGDGRGAALRPTDDRPRAITLAGARAGRARRSATPPRACARHVGRVPRRPREARRPARRRVARSLGTFYWQPGPGFIGRFELLFVRTDCDGQQGAPSGRPSRFSPACGDCPTLNARATPRRVRTPSLANCTAFLC